MPFGYRLRPPEDVAARDSRGSATLLICNLGEKGPGRRAVRIARQLSETSKRDVLLLSEAKALSGAEIAGAVETAHVDRLTTYEALVAVSPGDPTRLSTRMISLVSNLRVASLKRINPRGKTGSYVRPVDEAAKRALFIFPGLFTPPRIGSHQRAFSTVLDLLDDGFDVDILLKRTGSKLLERSRPYLAMLTGNLETYSVSEGSRDSGTCRSRFGDRAAEDFDDHAKTLVRDLAARSDYAVILVSFPWMLGVLDDTERGRAKIVCDTHDVVSNRWRELAAEDDPAAEGLAETERECLKRCDAVLAISRSDAKLFQSSIGVENVFVHPISYHREEPVAQWRSTAGPLSFGFIGSDMEANRRALQFIMTEWWPVIEEFSPDSRLTIAGSIAHARAVSPFIMLRENVAAAGFVDDLGGFLDSIDVLLSPSVVQAGVNVKNVEALLRRRPVVTNALGAASLDPLVIPTRCESPKGLLNIIRKIDRNDPGMIAALEKLYDDAAQYHAKPTRMAWT